MNPNANPNANRYTVHICKCGHIHFIENDEIDAAITSGKCLVTVCRDCGEIFVIGAEYVDDWYCDGELIEPAHYDMWSDVPQKCDKIVFSDFTYNHIPIYKIIFSAGKAVMLKSGKVATNFFGDTFWSNEMPCNFYDELVEYVCQPDFKERLLQHHNDNMAVDMDYILKTFSKEELLNLSKYVYKCFDWHGTDYEL